MGLYGGPDGCVFYWLHASCNQPQRVAGESWPHQFIYSAEHIVPIDNKEQPSTYLLTGKSTYNELIVKLISESGETIWSRAFAGETEVNPPLIGDFTGDDRADIVVGTSKSTLIFQQNSVNPYVFAYTAAGTTSNFYSLTNVDQDEEYELIRVNNHLDSSFGISEWNDTSLKSIWGSGFVYSTEFSIPALSDIDADGDTEVVIGVMDEPGVSPNWDTVLTVYDHLGDVATASAQMKGKRARDIKLADLDGDTKKEILLTTENQGLNTLSITVFDHLLQPLAQQPITESVVTTATPADLDYDGTLDLIYSPKKGELKVVDHQGNVRPGWPVALPNISTKPASPILVGNTDAHLQPEIIASTDCAPVVYSVWGEITQTIDEACGASSISLGESGGKTALFYTLPNKSAQFTLLSGDYHDQTMLWPIAGGNLQRTNAYTKLDYPSVSPLPTPLPTDNPSPLPTPILRGDITEPWGVVDSNDIRTIIELLFSSQLETGDLNDDGQVDIFDFNVVVSDFIKQ